MATKMVQAALDEDTSKPDPEKLRDARFAELCRRPVTDEAGALVDDLYTKVLPAEAPRERQRGVTKADALRAAVAGFTADLLSAALRGGLVYRPTHKNSFTGGPVTWPTFMAIRGALRDLRLIEEKTAWSHLGAFGPIRRYAPRFRATPALVALAGEHGVQLADLERHFPTPIPKEPLVLHNRARVPMNKIDYTDDVRALRQTIVDLNAFLEQFSIEGGVHRGYKRIFNLGDHPDFAWNMGGRLYSQGDGTYQRLPSEDRLKMTINGEAVCELDVRASNMMIYHAQHGRPLDPNHDPYDLLDRGEEGRWVVKNLLTITFGAAAFPEKWPPERGSAFLEKFKKKLGRHYSLRHVRDVVAATYPLMTELQPDAWAPLMYLESEAVLAAMLALKEREIPSLNVFDSLIVPERHETTATELLRSCYEQATTATPYIRCTRP